MGIFTHLNLTKKIDNFHTKEVIKNVVEEDLINSGQLDETAIDALKSSMNKSLTLGNDERLGSEKHYWSDECL